jgi:hypothetical protein
VDDVTIAPGYWGESSDFSLRGLSGDAMWFEVGVGIKANLWRNISAGWTVGFRNMFYEKKPSEANPWYVPGFGTRGSKLGASLSVYYTIPMNKHKWPTFDKEGKLLRNYGDPIEAEVDVNATSQPKAE